VLETAAGKTETPWRTWSRYKEKDHRMERERERERGANLGCNLHMELPVSRRRIRRDH
jgi:hypothetical protein